MKLQFRRRSLLIPVAAVLGSINNLIMIRFTDAEREQLLFSAFIEHLWLNYGVVGGQQVLRTPYAEGRFSMTLSSIENARKVLPYSTREVEFNSLRTKVFTQLDKTLTYYGMLTEALASRRQTDIPACFDHGFTLKVVSPRGKTGRVNGRWLLVEWVRPTLDMEEMSVTTFLQRIAQHLAKRKQPASFWLKVMSEIRLDSLLQAEDFDKILETVIAAGRNYHAPD